MELIVAVDQNWAIGNKGDQLVYLPTDLKHFKALTLGKTVILGRKTLATFPGGRPLKGRRNLILSRDPDFHPEGAEVCPNLDALRAALSGQDGAVVIGGASIYTALLPWCRTAYVTKIDAGFPADTWFPNLDQDSAWEAGDPEPPITENGLTFHYVTYRRRQTF